MNAHPPVWSGLSPEEHELHYNPRRAVPHFGQYQAERAPANGRARSSLRSELDLSYGEHPLRRLDIFMAESSQSSAPVHLFLHGGYWRGQDKENFAFVAELFVRRGVTAVIANYELAPASTLDGVVESALAATEWTLREIGRFGGDPRQLSLSGHSAGAHLVAEILAADWASRGLDPGAITGAMLISGIFDPAPALLTSVNAELRLTPEIAERHNVEARPPLVRCPVAIAVGGLEPWRWIEQSFRYSHHLRRHGHDPEVRVLPGWNHFDILSQYLDPDSPISRTCLRLVRATTAAGSGSGRK
jgi:arylformamidase